MPARTIDTYIDIDAPPERVWEVLKGGTRFRQRERFRGIPVLFMGSLLEATERGYHQMNQALKQWVEAREAAAIRR